MRLAIAIFRYFPYGGLQRDMLAIAQTAKERGHEVTVFCGDWQGEIPNGITVVQLKRSGLLNVAGVTYFVQDFQKQFQRGRFDLLLGFNKMPELDVYYCGDSCFAKKAYEERSFFYRLTPRARRYLQYENAVYSYLSKTHILEVSSAERSVFAKYYATTDERQTLLPPGIDPQLSLGPAERVRAREKVRSELMIAGKAPVVLCVGSGFKTKGLNRSISSFAAFRKTHPSAQLLVVGDGNPRPFRALINSLHVGDAIQFLGGREDMPDIYAAADLLLHPAYKEVTGNVIVEAMACALPVLVTSICGYAHYVVKFSMGELLVSPDDAATVAKQIEKLLFVQRSHWQAMAEQFIQTDIFSRPEYVVSIIERLAGSDKIKPLVQVAYNSQMHDEQIYVLRDELISNWGEEDVFTLLKNIQGTVVRNIKNRQTKRFEQNGNAYYCKWHQGVGWREIFKNLIQLRLPVLGAKNEWDALNKLRALCIPSITPVAYGVRGRNPARQESFIVTRELDGVVQADHYLEKNRAPSRARIALVARVAQIVRMLHSSGINHRDLYLCHFMVKVESLVTGDHPDVYLMDLHRAQCRPQVPRRWLIKDLASLYYSTLGLDLSYREALRFLRIYFDDSLRNLLQVNSLLLNQVKRRAIKMYRRDCRCVAVASN